MEGEVNVGRWEAVREGVRCGGRGELWLGITLAVIYNLLVIRVMNDFSLANVASEKCVIELRIKRL